MLLFLFASFHLNSLILLCVDMICFPGGWGMHVASSFLISLLNQQACIESQDPIIQALGFQSLSHLCEADVIGMLLCFAYTFFAFICFIKCSLTLKLLLHKVFFLC